MARRDLRRTVGPFLVSLLLLGVCVAVLAIPGGWLVGTFIIVEYPKVAAAAGLLLAAGLVAHFWRRHPVSGVAMAGGLILVGVALNAPSPAESLSRTMVDLIYVVRYRSALQIQMHDLSTSGESPAVAVIDIDGFGSMANGIAYDPTGEILLPPGKRSAAWTATGGQTELGVDGLEVRHIVGNYYSWFHY